MFHLSNTYMFPGFRKLIQRDCDAALSVDEQGVAQGGRAVVDGAPRGGDQPAVADEAVVEAVIHGELAGYPGRREAGGQSMAVVEQRVEAADDQMCRR